MFQRLINDSHAHIFKYSSFHDADSQDHDRFFVNTYQASIRTITCARVGRLDSYCRYKDLKYQECTSNTLQRTTLSTRRPTLRRSNIDLTYDSFTNIPVHSIYFVSVQSVVMTMTIYVQKQRSVIAYKLSRKRFTPLLLLNFF